MAFFNWLDSQSRPSYNPSPLVAQVAWMYQLRFLNECSPNLSVISAAFIAFGKSCLFANINSTASLSSSSASMRISSSFASPIRSLSLLSTTKIRPLKCKKHIVLTTCNVSLKLRNLANNFKTNCVNYVKNLLTPNVKIWFVCIFR